MSVNLSSQLTLLDLLRVTTQSHMFPQVLILLVLLVLSRLALIPQVLILLVLSLRLSLPLTHHRTQGIINKECSTSIALIYSR